jgi:nicotinamide mononucleotide (NMN) deamidase PncC
MVCFGTLLDGELRTSTSRFVGDRFEIRARAAQTVLYFLLRRLHPA